MNSKIILLIATAFLFAVYSFAQPSVNWEKSFGGTQYDDAYAIQQTSDSGYIIAGASISNDMDITNNHGAADYWIVKLKKTGAIDWQKSYGGTGYEQARDIQQTSDDGYIIAGYSESANGDVTGNHGGYDAWILKIDNAGVIQWQKSLGGSVDDGALSVRQTFDGGFIIAGHTNSTDGDITSKHGEYDAWIIKLNNTGTIIEWQKCFGGSLADEAQAVRQTADSGFVVVGYAWSNDGDVSGNQGRIDYWIFKLNKTGTVMEWQKCMGGTKDDYAYSIEQTADSGYIVAGQSPSNNGDVTDNHGGDDYWIVKLNKTGNTVDWKKSFGGSSDDVARCVKQTNDGGYIVAGRSQSDDGDVTGNHGDWDYWLVKLNSTGAIDWEKCLGGTAYDAALSVQQDIDSGYVVAGFASSNDGDVALQKGVSDYWIVKLNPVVNGISEVNNAIPFSIYPNPSSTYFTVNFDSRKDVEVNIYNVLGKLVEITKQRNQEGKIIVGDKLSQGVYFLKTKDELNFVSTFKLIKIK